MQRIEKKHLRKLNCPKCDRPKLRLEHPGDASPAGPNAPQVKLRCDVCKVQFLESDAAIQAALEDVLANLTPVPVSTRY